MSKFRVPEIVLGIGIGILLSLFAAGVGSYQTSQCEQGNQSQTTSPHQNDPLAAGQHPHQGDQQKDTHAKHPPFFACGAIGLFKTSIGLMDSHEGFFVGLFTLCLVFATILLWLSTEKLWVETRDTGKRQESDTRILQRAYVRAVPKGIGTMTSGELVAQISFENEGRLPATNFKWIVKPPTAGNGDWKPPQLHDSDLLEFSSIIPIAGIFRRGTDPVSPVSYGEYKYWFVWGRVKYLDGFGQERFVDFCHSYPIARRVMDTPISSFGYTISDEYARYHDYGNDAD